jgi:alpha-D-ribose 1-methylphosphonate 5-triphosphate synthase subunit PhnG
MPDASATHSPEIDRRRRWLRVLGQALRSELEAAWARLTPAPAYSTLRQAETGLVMVRGRIAGSGAPFNLGEMTMTRCAVRLADGPRTVGLSFIAGRDARLAELAAVFDALLLDPQRHAEIEAAVIAPIEAAQEARRRASAAEIAATRVDFFTLVREQA